MNGLWKKLDHEKSNLKSCDSGSACRSEADNACAGPVKMRSPGFEPRVEDANFGSCFGIDAGLSRALAQRAGHTGQREVVQRGRASRGLWNDVVNVEGCFLRKLGKKTVFAAIVRALDDGLPQVLRNRHAAIRFSCLGARSGGVATREGRLGRPSLQLHDVLHLSRIVRNPACRAIREAVVRHLPGGAVAPSHQAFRLQTERSEAYARHLAQWEPSSFNT